MSVIASRTAADRAAADVVRPHDRLHSQTKAQNSSQ